MNSRQARTKLNAGRLPYVWEKLLCIKSMWVWTPCRWAQTEGGTRGHGQGGTRGHGQGDDGLR